MDEFKGTEANLYPLLTLVWLHDKNWYLNKLFVSSAVFLTWRDRFVGWGGYNIWLHEKGKTEECVLIFGHIS